MTDILDLIDPVEITEYARLAQAEFDALDPLSEFLPYRGVNDVMYSYDKGLDLFVDEAQYRAFDAEPDKGRRPGGARISGSLLPIDREIPLSEFDQLRLRNAPDSALVDAHFADAAGLARGIVARTMRARAELFMTGNVNIAENGVYTTYESGRHGSLTVSTLASNDRWSAHATAKPIRDVIAWQKLIRGQTGLTANRLKVSSEVMAHLQACDEVRGALIPLANAPGLLTQDAVASVFLAMANVRIELLEPPAGLATPLVDPKKVLLVVDSTLIGGTLYGTPVEATLPDYSAISEQPGIIVGTHRNPGRVVTWTRAIAIPLPILAVPDATLCAQVVA